MNPNKGGRKRPPERKAMKTYTDISLNDRERQIMKVFNIIAGEFNGAVDESIISECIINYSGFLDDSKDVVTDIFEDVARRIGHASYL
jgi:hypothetical protein